MSLRKPCHMPFRKHIPPFTLTAGKYEDRQESEVSSQGTETSQLNKKKT